MNVIIKGAIHPNEDGIQILFVSSLNSGYHQKLMDIFNTETLLKLCKNEGEKERIKNFSFIIQEIGISRIICLGKEGSEWYELKGWLHNRLYIVTNRTDLLSELQKFIANSVCIITEYNDLGNTDYAEEFNMMIMKLVKSTP